MIVDDLDIESVSGIEPEHQTPRAVDADGPTARPITAELVQSDASEPSQIVEHFRGIELAQPQSRPLFIEP
jgi:hypothetical protein